MVEQDSKAVVEHPHEYFHAEIIKRAGQNIMLLTDHFSSSQTAMLIESEKAIDLKRGLILLTQASRRPGWIKVMLDNAKGFESLVKQNNEELKELQLEFLLTDVFNKNANAVTDKACQELEEELRKLSPEGKQVTQAQISRAVIEVNKKLRRRGELSAYEVNTARDMKHKHG